MLREVGSNFILKGPPNFLLRKFGIGNITQRAQLPHFFRRKNKFQIYFLPAYDQARTELFSLWPPVRPAPRCCAWPALPAAESGGIALNSVLALRAKP
jgi:hypothetical protein